MKPVINPLRARRAGLGFSQTVVAESLNKTQAWYSLIELGRYEPSDDDKDKIAAFLQCRVSDIFPKRKAA